jgi:hypothetical protein
MGNMPDILKENILSHYAHITNGIVDQVIVIDEETLATGHWGDPSEWKQTSYNTHGGVHATGGTPLRFNYAGLGYSYDAGRDAFIPPKPFASWLLNETSCLWDAPTPMPTDGKFYRWDEPTLSWVEVTQGV